MKKIAQLMGFALMMALAACSGESEEQGQWETNIVPSDDSGLDIPGQEGRIDGNVWADGWFRTEEDRALLCATPEAAGAWFCEVEKWASSEYHGNVSGLDGKPCYGSQMPNGTGDCLWPQLKQFKVSVNASCTDPNINLGIYEGARGWDGVGGVEVETIGGATPNWYQDLIFSCSDLGNGVYARGGLAGISTVVIGNGPVGPHSGRDADDFKTILDDAHMQINVGYIKSRCKTRCNSGISDCTAAQLTAFSRAIGKHEMGHVLGFGHFTSGGSLNANVMYPAVNDGVCIETPNIKPEFSTAIGLYNSSGGAATVTDNNLELWGPQ